MRDYYDDGRFEDDDDDHILDACSYVLPRARAQTQKRRSRKPQERFVYIEEKDTMKIIAVRYERVVSMGAGTYETERVAAEASVEATDNPGEVLRQLKSWVNNELGLDEEMTAEELTKLKRKVGRAERRIR